jgi:ABC-type hemin transport system substrate-binding protein
MGGENCFANRERRYPLEADLGKGRPELPGERDTRYPRIGREEIIAAQPEIIFLPSEPYPYDERHCQEMVEIFTETPAGRSGRVYLVDGTLITWHGTRLARALEELPEFFVQ